MARDHGETIVVLLHKMAPCEMTPLENYLKNYG